MPNGEPHPPQSAMDPSQRPLLKGFEIRCTGDALSVVNLDGSKRVGIVRVALLADGEGIPILHVVDREEPNRRVHLFGNRLSFTLRVEDTP